MTRNVLNNLLNRLYGEMAIALNWKEKVVLSAALSPWRGAPESTAPTILPVMPCAKRSSCGQNWRQNACSW